MSGDAEADEWDAELWARTLASLTERSNDLASDAPMAVTRAELDLFERFCFGPYERVSNPLWVRAHFRGHPLEVRC